MTSNYGNINRYLAAKTYRATLSILEKGVDEPRSVGDMMLLEILKRLQGMREVAVRAARLPLSDEERRICQGEIEKLKEEIESFAASIPPTPEPNADMGAIDDAIARISDMLAEWEERAPGRTDVPADAPQSENQREEEKIARWMDSLMRGWGNKIGRAENTDSAIDKGNAE